MPVITDILQQKVHKDRYNIYLDYEFAFGVSEEVLAVYKLKTGKELSQEELDEIKNEEYLDKTYNKVLSFIAYKPRTWFEINRKLNTLKTPKDISEKIISKIKETGLVKDDDYAQQLVDEQSFKKTPKGKRKLQEFLMKKGVDRNSIDRALANYDIEIEAKGATYYAEKSSKKSYELKSYLYSKGYSQEAIDLAMKE